MCGMLYKGKRGGKDDSRSRIGFFFWVSFPFEHFLRFLPSDREGACLGDWAQLQLGKPVGWSPRAGSTHAEPVPSDRGVSVHQAGREKNKAQTPADLAQWWEGGKEREGGFQQRMCQGI